MKINNKSDSKRQQTTAVDYKRLINGFFLTSVVTLHRQTDGSANLLPRGDKTEINTVLINQTNKTMGTMRNSVTLVGRPGAEPEVRIFGNNNKKARFSLAVTERKRNANNEWVNDTQWFPVVAWGKTAERIENNVRKGMELAINGTLRNNEWTDDKGQRHSITEVWVNDLLLMDKAKA